MAESVSAAIVQETVSQILSGLVQKYEEKEESNANRNLERLEMAHIRMEAALETSDKWQITDASLLRWRKKLKRASQECDDTLHKSKQRILEEEQMKREVKNSSLPNRIVHATKSFVSSILNRNNNELGRFTAQRFEWYAEGASEFVRFIELGGTPHHHMSFDSLVKNLFAGKILHHKIVRGNKYPSCQLLLMPIHTSMDGTNVGLTFVQYDGTPEGHIYFSLDVQLSESTDIFGIALKCLQFLPLISSVILKVQGMSLLSCPLKTSHGGRLFTTIRNTWTNSKASCCSGPGQTHFVASSMVTMRFNALATYKWQDYLKFC